MDVPLKIGVEADRARKRGARRASWSCTNRDSRSSFACVKTESRVQNHVTRLQINDSHSRYDRATSKMVLNIESDRATLYRPFRTGAGTVKIRAVLDREGVLG